MATFRPPHDRVLVQRIEAEEKTPGGIIIPDTAKEKPVEAEVIAVGPGSRSEDGVKAGDRDDARMSDSLRIGPSSPSRMTSVPDHLAKSTARSRPASSPEMARPRRRSSSRRSFARA